MAWLRSHWSAKYCIPLLSRATTVEFARVFEYAKFKLNPAKRLELLGDYLPFCETIKNIEPCPIVCRDQKGQMFLDLADSGKADGLVTGNPDLLALSGQTGFFMETPETYRQRVSSRSDPGLQDSF